MKKTLSNILVILGLFLITFSGYLYYLRTSSKPLRFETAPTTVNALSYESPRKIEIPSIHVALPIIPAVIQNKKWDTTTIGVSYLSSTPVPGQKGNSVLYGHNWESLLSQLPNVKPGQVLIITMQDGTKKEFKIEYTAVVNPSQTYIIDNTNDSRVTIYTCTGFLDSKRFVVVAKPTSV